MNKVVILDEYGKPYPTNVQRNKILASGYSNAAASLMKPVFKGWEWHGGAPDDDIVANLPVIRQRSRQLTMEAPIIAGLYNTLENNVVGEGLKPEPTPDAEYLGMTPEDVKKFKKTMLRLWEAFAESPNCFDSETEVLTKDGWQLFAELEGDELLATVNLETDLLEYQKPTHLISKEYVGEMVQIKGQRIDILVTPDHRMVTYERKWDGKKRKEYVDNTPVIAYAKDLTTRHQIKRGCSWDGEDRDVVIPASYKSNGEIIEPERNIDIGDWAEFLGWYVSEGCRCENKRGKSIGRCIIIYQSKGWKSDLIREILKKLPWKFHEGARCFVITSKQLYEALSTCGDGCFNKIVPQIIKDSSKSVIEKFLAAVILGDGHSRDTRGNKKYRSSKTYYTTSKLLADDIQELFIKTGLTARVTVRPPLPCRIRGKTYNDSRVGFIVSSSNNIRASIEGGIGKRGSLAKPVHYNGMVYCATVPNGTLIVRRNGIAFVCGNCDVYRRDNFYELTRLLCRSQAESGDCFVTMPRFERRGDPFALKIQVIEADCVGDPDGIEKFEHEKLGNDIFGGVEINEYGEVVGYWFYTGHPLAIRRRSHYNYNSFTKPKWNFIPAYGEETGLPNVLHLMDSKRPGQRRGIPLIAPIIELALTLDRYIKAEAIAAQIQAIFTLVITSENPDGLVGEMKVMDGMDEKKGRKGNEEPLLRLGNGIVQFLNPGEKVTPVESSHPSSNYGSFIENSIKMMGPAVNRPYETLVQNYQASFTASQAAVNVARRGDRVTQAGLVNDVGKPVYEFLVDEVVARGLISVRGYFDDPFTRKALNRAKWSGPGGLQIDLGKGANNYENLIKLGFATASEATSELTGGNYYENIEERGREIAAAKAAGISAAAAEGMTQSKAAIENSGGVQQQQGGTV